MPKISVVVPAYNAANSISLCVNSVLNQSFKDFEIVIVDDGSKDNSGKICDDFSEKFSNIKVIHTQNQGVSSARNIGIENSTGDYIFFLDSDDEILPDCFETYIDALAKENIDVIIGKLRLVENGVLKEEIGFNEKFKSDNKIWSEICKNPAPFGYAGGKMILRSIISNNKIKFNKNMKCQEDLDFFLSCYAKCKSFLAIPYAGYLYKYVASKREIPADDLLRNQIKMLDLCYQNSNMYSSVVSLVTNRMQNMLYAHLCVAARKFKLRKTINDISKLEGLEKYIVENNPDKKVDFISKCFCKKKYYKITIYLYLRMLLKVFKR